LNIPYERIPVDVVNRDNRQEMLGEKNPAVKIPILELDDGRYLSESNAILWYLARGTKYLPGDAYQQAKVFQWMFFEQNSHEPNLAVARYWVWVLQQPERFRDQLGAKQAAGREVLQVMERTLLTQTFFVAEQYSIADIALYAYTHVAPEGGFDLEPFPAIRQWLARMKSQPGYVPMDE